MFAHDMQLPRYGGQKLAGEMRILRGAGSSIHQRPRSFRERGFGGARMTNVMVEMGITRGISLCESCLNLTPHQVHP